MAKVRPIAVVDLDDIEKPVKIKVKGEIKSCKVIDVRADVYMNIKNDADMPKNRYKIILIEEK